MKNTNELGIIKDICMFFDIFSKEFEYNFQSEDYKKFRDFDTNNIYKSIAVVNEILVDGIDASLINHLNIKDTPKKDLNEFPFSNSTSTKIVDFFYKHNKYYDIENIDDSVIILNIYKHLFSINKTSIPVNYFYYFNDVMQKRAKAKFNKTVYKIKHSLDNAKKHSLGFVKIQEHSITETYQNKLVKSYLNNPIHISGKQNKLNNSLTFSTRDNVISLIKLLSTKEELENQFKNYSLKFENKITKGIHLNFVHEWISDNINNGNVDFSKLDSEEIQKINTEKKEFNKLKNWAKENELYSFLKRKFSEEETNTILATISRKDFKTLSFPTIPFSTQSSLFTFCYYIGYFEFLSKIKKLNLETIKSYNVLETHLNYFESNKIKIKVFRDYYKYKNNKNSKRYPFHKKEIVLKTIKNYGFNTDNLTTIEEIYF